MSRLRRTADPLEIPWLELCSAIRSRDADSVRTMIADGVDVNEKLKLVGWARLSWVTYHTTCLYEAIKVRRFDIGRMLIEAGANPNICGPDKAPPVCAMIFGDFSDQETLDWIQLLSAAGAEFRDSDQPFPANYDDFGNTTRLPVLIEMATEMDKVKTAAWLGTISGFSPLQISVVTSNRFMLRRWLDDPFTAWTCSPPLLSLDCSPAMRAMVESVVKPWSPSRNSLFHSAHRDTVRVIHEISKASVQKFTRSCRFYAAVPHHIWELIIRFLGREGWPLRVQPPYNRDPNSIPLGY